MITAEQWKAALVKLGCSMVTAGVWSRFFEAEVQPEKFSRGATEIPAFLSQVLHESGYLERLEESLNYTSADRLRQIWPRRFPTMAEASQYVRNPVALAEKVYGGRLGNKITGDAWKYRGSGPIQVTGRDNFSELQKVTGLPLLNSPDLLRIPGAEPLRVCVAWWERNVPDDVLGNPKRIRREVNGGYIGLPETVALAQKAERIFA